MTEISAMATVETAFGQLSYFSFDNPIGTALQRYRGWATVEIKFLRQFITPGATVLDGGANVGMHSLAFAQWVGMAGKVVSVEASPETCAVLRSNMESNGLAHVEVVCAALDAEAGTCLVERLNPERPQNVGMLHTAAHSPSVRQPESMIETAARTIDSLELDELHLLKLDVEGSEYRAIKGGLETIRRHRPVILTEALDLEGTLPVLDLLRPLGYKPFFCSFSVYDPDNEAADPENIFGFAREASLLFVQSGAPLPVLAPGVLIAAVNSADDLARHLTELPRFGDRTGHDRVLAEVLAERNALQQQLDSQGAQRMTRQDIEGELLNIWQPLSQLVAAREVQEAETARLSLALKSLTDQMASQERFLQRQGASSEALDRGLVSLKLDLGSVREAMIGRNEDRGLVALAVEDVRGELVKLQAELQEQMELMRLEQLAIAERGERMEKLCTELNQRLARLEAGAAADSNTPSAAASDHDHAPQRERPSRFGIGRPSPRR
jgi:FkbM family methyltransferase